MLRSGASRDRLAAAAVGLLSLAGYLRTLYPRVGGGGDAVKFQYLGHVLGTAHAPGYPLYVLADGRLMVRIDNYRPFDTVAVVYLAGGGRGATGVGHFARSCGACRVGPKLQDCRGEGRRGSRRL